MNSEFRQDLVSGDWVVISPKRFKRLGQFKEKNKRKIISRKNCPFENPQKSGHDAPFVVYPNLDNWKIQVIQNKFPIAYHKGGVCAAEINQGPFSIIEGVGRHDVVITRDHFKNFTRLSSKEAEAVFHAFKERYQQLSKDKCLKYVFIFHNWGPKAGASVFHPHYQILSMPIIPPDVSRSLRGSKNYFDKNNKCVHCVMLKYDRAEKKRIVFENSEAIAIAPFISREPFELRIFPKKHFSYFEKTPEKTIKDTVQVLQKSLFKLEKKLNDPDYNFFIHTAPIDKNGKFSHYHWHIEVLPKFSVSAGVELGTGIEVTVVDPVAAAKILK